MTVRANRRGVEWDCRFAGKCTPSVAFGASSPKGGAKKSTATFGVANELIS